jgi:hypothetical protein
MALCEHCGLVDARLKAKLNGVAKQFCKKCYRDKVREKLIRATGKEPDFEKCNTCGRVPNKIVYLRLGISDGKLGIYCQDCINSESPVEIIGGKKDVQKLRKAKK